MPDLARQVEMLERENERLRDELAALRGMPADVDMLPPLLGLTGKEGDVLMILLAKEVATKDQIHFALYGNSPDGGAEPKIVDVFICKIRKKLKLFGIEIGTVWGRGYRMSPPSKAQLRALCDQMRGRPADPIEDAA